jgi:hypothetical protein
MATVQTPKPSRLELHEKSVKHVMIIVAYYFECGLTRDSYSSCVSMDFGQHPYDNGMSPALPISLLRVTVVIRLSKNPFLFFCNERALSFLFWFVGIHCDHACLVYCFPYHSDEFLAIIIVIRVVLMMFE